MLRIMPFMLALAACASAPETRLHADRDEPILLARSQAFELHVRDGRVVQIVPAALPGGVARSRVLRDYEDLRRVYSEGDLGALPPSPDDEAVTINGWAGLECVREGKACGPPPAEAPRVMVLIRFR